VPAAGVDCEGLMNRRIAGIFAVMLVILYLIMGVVQFFAIIAGVHIWWGIGWLEAAIASFALTYTPLVGAALSVVGAVSAWGWNYIAAAALFFFPYILYFLALVFFNFIIVCRSFLW